eukprot:UC1_evm1s1770
MATLTKVLFCLSRAAGLVVLLLSLSLTLPCFALALSPSQSVRKWTTLDQARVPSVPAVVLAATDTTTKHFAYVVTGVKGNSSANLTSVTEMWTGTIDAPNAAKQVPLCAHKSCSRPAFQPARAKKAGAASLPLAFVADGDLYVAGNGGADAPTAVNTGGEKVLWYAWAPHGRSIAYTVAQMSTHDPVAPRVLDEDVIINVIQGTPSISRNILCVVSLSKNDDDTTAETRQQQQQQRRRQRLSFGAPRCYESGEMPGSVGIAAWTISCWPYESVASWSPDGERIAFTYTNTTFSDDWTAMGVAELTVASGAVAPVAGATAFQPTYSPQGALAYTRVNDGDYIWAQTWHVCVRLGDSSSLSSSSSKSVKGSPTTTCSPRASTRDNMAALAGWTADGSELVYTEQDGTAVRMYRVPVDAATGALGNYEAISTAPLTADGVVGGGFRATSRPNVLHAPDGKTTMLAFTWESFSARQEGYIMTLPPSSLDTSSNASAHMIKATARSVADIVATATVTSPFRITARGTSGFLPDAIAQHKFPRFATTNWTARDGTVIEGIMALPTTINLSFTSSPPPPLPSPSSSAATTAAAAKLVAPPPLLVFTHCGPAMAVLATFVGYGSVCARFPFAALVEAGYGVIMPNYRGSTGYGPGFRRADRSDWGGSDLDDVLSGARALVARGLARKDAIAHVGWSYGGYLGALALGTAESSHGVPLRAVVAGGTLTDLISHTGTTDISRIIASWAGGYHWDSPTLRTKMMAHSGIYHVENATAPTLLLHGIDDPRMPLSQAFQLHYALKARAVETRFVAFPGSGHIPADPGQILRVWDETEAWLSAHMPATVADGA